MDKINTRTATIYFDENKVLHIRIHDGVKIDYEDALDIALVVQTLTNKQKVLKLIDARANFSIVKKARKLIRSKEIKENTIARAIVKDSLFSKLIRSIFIILDKTEIPTKVFEDYDKAYKWLLIQGIKTGKFNQEA